MLIESFKDRVIDESKTIQLYRCLNRSGRIFSVKQKTLVVGHTQSLQLSNCTFKISKPGQDRARSEKTRNVHAVIIGTISNTIQNIELFEKISYNPFKTDYFYIGDIDDPIYIESAETILVTEDGIFGKGIKNKRH